jgi:hypothetical protein
MSLLDAPAEPQEKSRVLIFTVVTLVLAGVITGWFLLRYYPEKKAASRFFDALVAGDTNRAYQLWKPSESYKMQDFIADWGPNGYYGPVKSYSIVRAQAPRRASGVIVSIAVSPFAPMPEVNDAEKSRRTKVIPLWVDAETKSISFSPITPEE